MIVRKLNYLSETEAVSLLEQAAEVGRILNGLLAALKAGKK